VIAMADQITENGCHVKFTSISSINRMECLSLSKS